MTIDKKIAYDMQGGVRNYLGKQKTVSDVPLKWKSGPDKPATELAYITKAEKDLLLKKDIHGSLKNGPNEGPAGIMSLDSAGDKDGPVGGYSGADVSAAETGKAVKGMSASDLAGFRAGAISAGARAGLNETQAVTDQVKALQNKYGPRVGTNRFGDFFSPSNILSGLGSLISGPLGLATKAFGFLGDKVQDLRGYNPDGTPRTQAEYEQARFDRINQDRIDNILNRDAPITEMTQRTLEKLGYTGDMPAVGSTRFSRAVDRDLINDPEMPQFSRSYIQSLAQPNINTTPAGDRSRFNLSDPFEGRAFEYFNDIDRFSKTVGPRAVNVPGAGITGIDVNLPGNNLMADALTTPTAGQYGLDLIELNTLKNAGYSNREIEEAAERGYAEELVRDIRGPIG